MSTSDGVLIARHEVDITGATDVANHPEFAARRTTKTIDGITTTGWFADDFTLAEIKTLRAIQRLSNRPQQFNGLYQIPTLVEVIRLASYHDSVGLSLEEPLVATLDRFGLDKKSSPVFIQSFEVSNLKELNHMTRHEPTPIWSRQAATRHLSICSSTVSVSTASSQIFRILPSRRAISCASHRASVMTTTTEP